MKPPSLAIYAIFRNEQRHVAQWAETTGDADYRVVVDTGSGDGTVAELDLHGIPHVTGIFEPFRFDLARNMSLAMVPTSIDLCMMLDADETLIPGWREAINDTYHRTMPRYRYTVVNRGSGNWLQMQRSNLHRRHGFRWVHPIHEALDGPPGEIAVPGLVVEHWPDVTKSRNDYLGMLKRATMEDPTSSRMAYYYGRELWFRGSWAPCRTELARYLEMPGWSAERSEAYRILGAIDSHPERWFWRAIAEAPERREPYVDLARHYAKAGRVDEARAMVDLARRRDNRDIYVADPACWDDAFDDLATQLLADQLHRIIEPA